MFLSYCLISEAHYNGRHVDLEDEDKLDELY